MFLFLFIGRDSQVILWLCSFCGGFLGLFYDLFRIPAYVRRVNNESNYLIPESDKDTPKIKPPIKLVSIVAQILYAYLFSIVFYYLIPPARDFEHFIGIFIFQ